MLKILGVAPTLAESLREAGAPLTYRVAREMPHVWHLFVGLLPETEASLEEIAAFVRQTTSGEAH